MVSGWWGGGGGGGGAQSALCFDRDQIRGINGRKIVACQQIGSQRRWMPFPTDLGISFEPRLHPYLNLNLHGRRGHA